MKAFTYQRADSTAQAAAAALKPGTKIIAGGTNLLEAAGRDAFELGRYQPATAIDACAVYQHRGVGCRE
jgi:CO/xanthine dehydrogenase FAD-binding subunit